jgi:phosphatidylcholine synthase
VLLLQYPDPHPLVVAASFAYLGYYWAVSLYLTALAARRRRTGGAAA